MLRATMFILTAFLFVVVTFMVSAHETGMAVSGEFASRMQHMEHAAPMKVACTDDARCKADADLCSLVCMGAGAVLLAERASERRMTLGEEFRLQPGKTLIATAPSRLHRPPIVHLL